MNLLDMRTVLSSYMVSSLISVAVMVSLWTQNRRRSPGLVFWLAYFIMQFLGLLLVILRDNLPDFFSMLLSNLLIVGGTWLLLIGLERYTGKTGPQWFNFIFMAVFFLVQTFFVYVQDSLQARTINYSLGTLVMCAQCAWLLLHRVDPELRPGTRPVGVVFVLFSLVSYTRIFVDLAAPQGNDLFQAGLYDTLGVLAYEMLYISLTFTLVLMVNRRLFTALESDIRDRKMAEAALKVSEEKFSVAFHNSPDAIVINSLPDGKIIDANESFFTLSGYDREESLGRTIDELDLWDSLDIRKKFLDALQKQHRVLNFEANFRRKSNKLFIGSVSGELIRLQGQSSVLSVAHDITERKRAEAELKYMSTHDALTGLYNRAFFIAEMQRLERGRKFPVSVVMGDVDRLKETNDKQGHPAGDALLKRVAKVLTAAFRAEDVIARIGGDEFAVLLPETDMIAAEVALQRVRKMIQESNAAFRGTPVNLSLGVSTARNPGPLSVVLKEADSNMYREKRGQAGPQD